MNWTNREKYYLVDDMELISESIKKDMEIENAIECQNVVLSFLFVI